MHLLDLPLEIILQILSKLLLADLFSCLSTNRILLGIIRNSVLLQYRIETQLACVEDNSKSNLPLSERLSTLRNREHAWAHFEYNFETPIHVMMEGNPTIYDLTHDIYLVGDAVDQDQSVNTAIKYIRLPSSPPSVQPQPPWARININRPIVDFRTAIHEHNLIAMVTYLSDTTSLMFSKLEVVLINFSTGAHHEMAQQPIIFVNNARLVDGPPDISMEIVGENMGLVVLYPHGLSETGNLLYIYDWKRGSMKMEPVRVYNNGLVFLSEDVILHPNKQRGSLDIYYIPPSSDDLPATHVRSLLLPELCPPYSIRGFSCRGEPNPMMRGPTSMSMSMSSFTSRPFSTTSDDSIVKIELDLHSDVLRSLVLVAHRRSLLAHMPSLGADSDKGLAIVEWDAWGPSVTRWFNFSDLLSIYWITTTTGQRYVETTPSFHGEPSPIRILDFNPYHVRRLQAQGGSYSTPTCRVRVVTGFDEESFVWRQSESPRVFKSTESVRSTLPYVECTSKKFFVYDAVVMDEERVIGMRYNLDSGTIQSFDVLYFG